MNERDKLRREVADTLHHSGERPATSIGISRRMFLHRSLITGTAATAAACGWFPLLNTIDMAFAAEGGQTIRFAWISDTHLYPADVNERFVEKTKRAVREVQEMDPPADFLIFGGDLAQLADPVELRLGADILKELDIKQVFIPGEHDWYLDMGELWVKQFGESPWAMEHKGVTFIGLNTVGQAPDYWSAKNMSPEERMGHMAVLDGTVAGPWAGLGHEQLQWLQKTVSDLPKDKPIVIFSHNPLYEYYPPWNFWVRDWREVHEILGPYQNVTNVHGHTHQVLYNEIGKMRSIGMLATSWPWPYAPEGVPELTKPMVRVDPGDHFDGVGWSSLAMASAEAPVENEYKMWRKQILANDPDATVAQPDSGTGDNHNQKLHKRIADQMWPY